MQNSFDMLSNHKKGFTLVELMLSIALIVVVAAFSIPLTLKWHNSTNLSLAAQAVALSARRAQLLSQSMKEDSVWGVKIDELGSTVFKGSAYSSRDSAYDELSSFNSIQSISGNTEIVFTAPSGNPTSNATLVLYDSQNASSTILINRLGFVLY